MTFAWREEIHRRTFLLVAVLAFASSAHAQTWTAIDDPEAMALFGGWNVGSVPILGYDHEAEDWTIPLNVTFGKTLILGGRPWKLGVEVNYFVEQPDAFGPQWLISVNVAPVVENVVANLFK